MELRWWPVAVIGVLVLGTVIAVAALAPMARMARVLRPLANVERLTRLPEYARVDRVQFWSMLITLILLVTTFGAALLTTARPVGFSSATRNFEAVHPEDIMLCVGEPVTDPTTAIPPVCAWCR